MPNRVPAVHLTKARHSSMRTSSRSTGVSWRVMPKSYRLEVQLAYLVNFAQLVQ